METKLLVTVDTEEDWQGPGEAKEPTVNNIYQVPGLQKDIFDGFGIKPVYLATHTVVTDPNSVTMLKELYRSGRCEIGAHLHSWFVPPIEKQDIIKKNFQFSLPYSIEKQKVETLTRAIEENFQIRPVSFRAGRWGADGETIKILAELGYKVDVSVTPLVDYTEEGGMDFFDAPFIPYFPSFNDITVPSQESCNEVLEIPVTIGFSRMDFERMKRIYKIALNFPKALCTIGILYRTNILRKIKLSPEVATFSDMRKLTDLCLMRNHKILHLTFHSSINSVGDSLYSRTQKERNMRMKDLQDILDYIVNVKNIKSCTAKEIYEEHQKR
jgi:peptidoglycan/xylan/chitin deacetylase (PgdA/CDA1 family)